MQVFPAVIISRFITERYLSVLLLITQSISGPSVIRLRVLSLRTSPIQSSAVPLPCVAWTAHLFQNRPNGEPI